MRPRLVEEICAKTKLDVGYHNTLATIIARIEGGGCEVLTRDDGIPSSYDPYTSRPPIIRVNLRDVDDPLNIFWRLFHEYGHHLSGDRQKGDHDLDREELAWQKADELIVEYPDLLLCKDDYERCREHDLNTYRVYYARGNN